MNMSTGAADHSTVNAKAAGANYLNGAINPLLVQLYDSHQLYQMAGDKKPQIRTELMHAVTGLLDLPLKNTESELVSDILISLLRQAETDLRQAIAERLAVIDDVPLRLILKLANDDIGIAEKVLKQSNVLSDIDLIYIIQAQGPAYWRAIAARANIGPQLIDTLAQTHDKETAIVLAKNDTIELTENAVQILAEIAKTSSDLAQPLLQRAEVPASLAYMLYDYIGTELKAYVADKYGSAETVVDDVIAELTGWADKTFVPSSEMIQSAEIYAVKGMLNSDLMVKALKRGQFSTYIAYFSRYTGLKADMVYRILQQKCGQGLAIACKATGVSRQDFISMYMLTQRMRQENGVLDSLALNKAMTYYDRVSVPVAKRIMRGPLCHVDQGHSA